MIEKLEIDRRERLTRLWLEAESTVRAFVFSAVPEFQDAEDVVQQVALTVARRFDEYDTARTTAETIFGILDGMPTRTLNGTEYKWAAARQEPFLLNRDEAGRVLIACNYDVVRDA